MEVEKTTEKNRKAPETPMTDATAVEFLRGLVTMNKNGMLDELFQEEHEEALNTGISALLQRQAEGSWAVRESQDDLLFPDMLTKEEKEVGHITSEIPRCAYLLVMESKQIHLAYPGLVWTNRGCEYAWNVMDWNGEIQKVVYEDEVAAYKAVSLTGDCYDRICGYLNH